MSSVWPPVLMYHSISQLEDDPNRLCTSPEQFEAQIRYLQQRGLQGVSLRKLHRAVGAGATKGLIGLTFDDGYEDFLHTAVPILERFGFSATVFVVGGVLGGENDWEHVCTPRPRLRLLDADGVRAVSERGMEVGSHTMTHPRLSRLEPELLKEEVDISRRVLSEVLGGEAVEGFCYPYGFLDRRVMQIVYQEGYAYACSIFARPKRNNYDLPRLDISSRDTLWTLAAKLQFHSQYFAAKRVHARHIPVQSLVRVVRNLK